MRASTGKSDAVAPNSGDMLESVARSGTDIEREPAAAELDELVDDAVLAEQLGEREHEVGGGGPGGQRVVEAHADDHRREQEERLTEHAGLGLDAADAPAEHADAVDHRRVRIGADQRVRQRGADTVDVADLHHLGEVLEVDLVDDAHPRRDDPEALERLLRPAEQRVALAVALVLARDVALVRLAIAEGVHLHRVVDHQVDRHQRIDAHRVAAGPCDRGPHRREVDDRRDAGEVLEEHPGGHERALAVDGRAGAVPARRSPRRHPSRTEGAAALRTLFSSRIFSVTGRRETSPMPRSASAPRR